jgi:hypothetical protein
MVATSEVGICYRPPADIGTFLIADAEPVFDPSEARPKEKEGKRVGRRKKRGEGERRREALRKRQVKKSQ